MIKPKGKTFEELAYFDDMRYDESGHVIEDDYFLDDDDEGCITFGKGNFQDDKNEFLDEDFGDIEELLATFHEETGSTIEVSLDELASSLREKVKEFFEKDGILARKSEDLNGRKGEYRPQQMEMALKIVNAIQKGENLCVEAPTGVGKSFAYLIPLIYRAEFAEYPAIITTETINLQEQLIEKDIPFLKKILGNPHSVLPHTAFPSRRLF